MFRELENTFEGLLEKFNAGVKWINKHWMDPKVRGHIREFKRTVVMPMDEAWEKMPEEKKREHLNQL